MLNDKNTDSNEKIVKRNVRDSVFTNLFQNRYYTKQLYEALHPEAADINEEDIEIVTIENVLLNQQYNDLGFVVNNQVLLLVEAQSTWSENIIVRGLLYLAKTIQSHITDTKQNLHGSKKLQIPMPELYVLYTGDSQNVPDVVTLSDSFFGRKKSAVEVRVKVFTDGKNNDIISQYVSFTKIFQEQLRKFGRKLETIIRTVNLCIERNILREYLEKHKKEVVDIMTALYDKEQIIDLFIYEQREESKLMAYVNSVLSIKERFHMSNEEAVDILNVTKKEREEILQMLNS